MVPTELGGPLSVVMKKRVRDLLSDLDATGSQTAGKIEDFAIGSAGIGWRVTDNDGTNDSPGETLFWFIGAVN